MAARPVQENGLFEHVVEQKSEDGGRHDCKDREVILLSQIDGFRENIKKSRPEPYPGGKTEDEMQLVPEAQSEETPQEGRKKGDSVEREW
jgi:hypothetical protein